MKTLRFRLHVLDMADAEEYLDLVTDVPGVIAAIVDGPRSAIDVIVSGSVGALMVEGELRAALGQPPVSSSRVLSR